MCSCLNDPYFMLSTTQPLQHIARRVVTGFAKARPPVSVNEAHVRAVALALHIMLFHLFALKILHEMLHLD